MLDALDKDLLKAVADLEDIPKGAYNIRKNGKLLTRATTANIDIESNADGTGIVVTIAPGTKDESVHIPVILSQAGLYDVVYNNFIIGDGADVTIVAGCGIHCGTASPEGHAGIHEFRVGKGAKVKYVEKHYATGAGSGRRTLNPTTKVFLAEGAQAEMELTQIGGVDEANRVNEATLEANSLLMIMERVLTEKEQSAVSKNENQAGGRQQPGQHDFPFRHQGKLQSEFLRNHRGPGEMLRSHRMRRHHHGQRNQRDHPLSEGQTL